MDWTTGLTITTLTEYSADCAYNMYDMTPFHNTQLQAYAHAHSNPHTMQKKMMESHELEESGAIQPINDNYDATLSPLSLSSSSSYLLSVKGRLSSFGCHQSSG